MRARPKPPTNGEPCPACKVSVLHDRNGPNAGLNAWSRYCVDVPICSGCGMREAVSGFFWIADCPSHLIKPEFKSDEGI